MKQADEHREDAEGPPDGVDTWRAGRPWHEMTNGESEPNMLMSGIDVLVSAALACLLEDTEHGRHWLRENGLKGWPLHWYQDADGEWKA